VPYYPPAASSGLPTTGGTMTGTITSTMGTITSDTPMITGTQTWNASGTTFRGIFLNVTNTASASASRVFDIQTGGTSCISLTAGGVLHLGNTGQFIFFNTTLFSPNSRINIGESYGGLGFSSGSIVGWGPNVNSTNSKDTGLSRNAAGVVEVNNGTTGTFRDLKLRDLIATVALNVQGASASVGSGISIGGAVRTTVGAAGGASALPATPTGYIDWYVGSTAVGIPYYVRGA
jgi:hypothetical protein